MNVPARRRTRVLAAAVPVALVLGGTTVALATSQAERPGGGLGAAAVGTGAGGCKTGFDTRNDQFAPPNGGAVVGSVTFTKGCPGPVLVNFTSETSAPEADDFIHVSVRATCLGAGGQTNNPCTAGAVATAGPGTTFLVTGPQAGGIATRGMNFAFGALQRGQWQFEVIAFGDEAADPDTDAFVWFRTTTAEAV